MSHREPAFPIRDIGDARTSHCGASIADLEANSETRTPQSSPAGAPAGTGRLDTKDGEGPRKNELDGLVDDAGNSTDMPKDAPSRELLLDHQRLIRDLKSAEQVQHRFLPQVLPEIPRYLFFAFYQPAYEIGGDYYDFVPLPGDRLGIALGDVSGKGVAAALVMAKFSGNTRYHLQAGDSPAAAARVLNNALCESGIDERFITLSLSMLDSNSGQLLLCSAGHPSALLRRADGTVEEPGKGIGGVPLGIVPDAEYREVEVELRPGDVMVVYSDGVTDSRNPTEELYDTQENRRLLRCVREAAGSPEAVGRAILEEIGRFSRGHTQADDITLVCFGPAPRQPERRSALDDSV